MGVIYLDIDDEITSAANRIRSAREPRIALVLPAGTRLATSRINFRLLAREAIAYRRELAIVAPEPAARALAAAAGLPVFSSVVEYEVAVAALGGAPADDGEPRGGAAETGPDGGPANSGIDDAGGAALAGGAGLGGPAAQTGTPEATRIMQSGATGGAAAGTRRAPSVRDTGGLRSIRSGGTFEQVRARSGIPTETIVLPPDDRSASQRGHRGLLVGLVALVGLVLVAGGVGAWLLLPDAVITIRARPEPIGPVQFTVRADPLAASMDQQAGVVPAQLATFDLSAQGTFPSTGRKVTETKAAGSLRWTNCDPTRSYTIAAGTVARTNASVGFSTASDVFLPVAILSGNPPQITCQSRDVRITATDSGLAGNVPAGAIDQVPTNDNSVVIRVTNLAATSGGTHVVTKIVAQKDVDKAQASLEQQLAAQLSGFLADPTRAPAGTTLFPATVTSSAPVPSVDPTNLVGQAMDTFELGLTGTATATAVDESLVQQLAEARIRAAVTPGDSVVSGSVQVQLGTAKVTGPVVSFPVTAQASQVGTLDAAAIRELVKGRPVDEVRALLRNYGDATVDVWPAWVTTIPTIDFRLDVQTVSDIPVDTGPGASAGGGPSVAPAATPTPTPPPSPTPTRALPAAPSPTP